MLFLNVATVLFTTSSATILTAFAASSKDDNSSCSVKAWARAEDLSPNKIANGDLRIKVNPLCTDEVVSVALQLRFDEFSEVKHPKEGATLPTLPDYRNGSSPSCSSWCGRPFGDSDIDKYHELIRDPALWVLKAEERSAFKSVVTLIDKPFDYSQPVIVPFAVAVPNVNYPPALQSSSHSWSFDSIRTANSKHAYRYIAFITFRSGREVEIPAGYTTFYPTHDTPLPTRPFASNITLEEEPTNWRWDRFDECAAGVEKTVFEAQVTLEGGNVVRIGDTIKGKIALHGLVNGSTTAEHVSIKLSSERYNRWAQAQAASGGDVRGFLPSSYDREVSTSSCQYDHIFGSGCTWDGYWGSSYPDGTLSQGKQYLDFELKVPEDTIRDFRTYYVTSNTSLVINLDVVYTPPVHRCIFGDQDEEEDVELVGETDQHEEDLWDENTPVGQPRKAGDYEPEVVRMEIPATHRSTQTLSAKIPIMLIGTHHLDASPPSSSPPVHYLTPGAASPLILASPPSSWEDVVFPVLQPIITPEPIENTTARLLPLPPSQAPIQYAPDPRQHYHSGPYAGLLWKKKMVAEDTASVVVPVFEEVPEHFYGLSDFQVAL